MWQSFIGDPKAGYYSVGAALWLNIRMFLAAEVLILILALVIALVRQSVARSCSRCASSARSTWTSSAGCR